MRRPRRAPARRARPLSVGSPWLIATRSAGKLRELRPIFADAGVRVIDLVEAGVAESPDEDAIEIHATFEANALAKARWFFARCGGLDVVADDSGLAVDALGGAPGVRSKRWSGRTDLRGEALDEANNAQLVARLRGVADRSARFVCAAAWCGARGELVTVGEHVGRIVDSPSGTHGFGYDPYFFSAELGMTLADATTEQKRRVSHRGRAFDALVARLRESGVLPQQGDSA
jgi:XTP/dITP diphosphohydrolase